MSILWEDSIAISELPGGRAPITWSNRCSNKFDLKKSGFAVDMNTEKLMNFGVFKLVFQLEAALDEGVIS